MPITINVGRSRKLSKDFNSQGFSLNIEAELPANCLEDPQALAQQTGTLFQLAEDLLDEQVRHASGHGEPKPRTVPADPSRPNGQAYAPPRGMTDAQKRAITNMCQRLGDDAGTVARALHGVSLEELTIRQASEVIDALKDRFGSAKSEIAA